MKKIKRFDRNKNINLKILLIFVKNHIKMHKNQHNFLVLCITKLNI